MPTYTMYQVPCTMSPSFTWALAPCPNLRMGTCRKGCVEIIKCPTIITMIGYHVQAPGTALIVQSQGRGGGGDIVILVSLNTVPFFELLQSVFFGSFNQFNKKSFIMWNFCFVCVHPLH